MTMFVSVGRGGGRRVGEGGVVPDRGGAVERGGLAAACRGGGACPLSRRSVI